MKKTIVGLSLILAACAQPPTGSNSSGNLGNNAPDNEVQQRARAFTDLAGAYFQRSQYKVALDELRKAIQVDPNFGPAYNIYGLVYMELAEDKLAEDYFRRAIELNQNDSESRNNYGWFLCTRGRHDEGLAQFSDALKNPLYASPEQAMTNAGMCAEMKGDLALAEANLTRALKLQPDNAQAMIKLAGLKFRQGKLEEAQRLLARHSEIAQPSAESLWLGVRLERKSGNRTQEAAYGLQLRKRFPDSNEARSLLAGQYE
ncbi:MAG: type IV pilus biogenesis/stability protein PilW [Thiobacillaceae bacterium]